MDIQPNIDNQQMLPKGTVLHGTYRIERYLASGGFGNTYVATNEAFDEIVVIKEFFIRGTAERGSDQRTVSVSQSNQPLFTQQLQKFKKEAQRLRKINNSHIVRVHDLFEENGTAYYVMDLIDGSSLSQVMKEQQRPFTEDEVVNIVLNIADALEAVHALPLQHLDIKPGNIMRDKQGRIYLIDFGACKQIGADGSMTTTTTSMCYTPGYAPVEQMDQRIESIGAWTDIYALGATAYNLLTQQKPPLPSDVLLDGADAFNFPDAVSPRMRQFVTTCMTPSFRKRPYDVKSMLALLQVEAKEAPPVSDNQEEEVTVVEVAKPKQPVAVKAPKIESSRETFTINGVSFDMIKVEGGKFWMGAQKMDPSGSNYDEEASECEGPVHQKTVGKFYIGETQVTQELWKAVMGSNPSAFKGLRLPVEQVNWNDCQSFVQKLNTITGRVFRLPTEAEWEFAARGGNQSVGLIYSGDNTARFVAWYSENSSNTTHPVKQKSPNELGLYDMSGNVWEWTSNNWRNDYSSSEDNSCRVLRGGSWHRLARYVRVSFRYNYTPDSRYNFIGLRLALDPQ